jgi:putative transposase
LREISNSRQRTAIFSPSCTVFAGHNVSIRQVADKIWLVSLMQYDLGFFDHETCRIESAENPFGAKVLPMSPV